MLLPLRAFTNPVCEQCDLAFRKGRTSSGHPQRLIRRRDALNENTVSRIARNDRKMASTYILFCRFLNIEVKGRSALRLIRTMARETFVRKYRPDVSVELDCFRRCNTGGT